MSLNKIATAAACAALLLALAGCSSDSGTASSTTGSTAEKSGGGKTYKITMIAKSSTNPVFLSAQKGAEDAAKELSKDGTTVTIDWQTPANEDPHEQATNVQNAANSGSSAILISCTDATLVKGAIDDAVDKGIPVMSFDSDATGSKRFAYYGADDEDCGTQVMDQLAKQLNGKGQVAILAGTQTAPNLQKRAQAVRDEAKKYPGITIVDTFYHKETPEDAAQKVVDTMKAYPQINGWAMIGGWPLFTTTLLNDLDPNKVKVVAVDALPLELPYVEKGIAPVLLAQPCYMWGYKSVHMIYDKLANGKNPPEITKMPLIMVDKQNLGEWAQQLKAWGFDNVDPKYLALAKDPGDIAKSLQ